MKRPDDDSLARQRSGHRERLRQRLLQHGISSLHSYEVLEYLLFMLLPRRDTKAIAKNLLERFKTVSGVFEATFAELVEFGFTERAAADILFLREAVKYQQFEKLMEAPALNTPEDTVEYLQTKIGRNPKESLVVFYLNSARKVAGVWETEGTVNSAPAAPREVVERALYYHATAVILAHNHPSGSKKPSHSDIQFTKDIYNALELFGIRLLDHIIVTGKDYIRLM